MEIINYQYPDPVHQEEDLWYFWDETWGNREGPYLTEAIARSELEAYSHWLDTGERKAD